MKWTQPLGVLCALGVVLTVLGAALSLVTGPLTGFRAVAAVVSLAVVAVGVALTVGVGTRFSPRWLDNPYW